MIAQDDPNAVKKLCLDLLYADSEEEVVDLLQGAGYWDDPSCWRLFGDKQDNFSRIGSQASRPEAALAEKVVNSIDARLMNECLATGTDPESDSAPPTIRGAVARYFEGREVKGEVGGKVREWGSPKISDVSTGITVTATGGKKRPCFTIADIGEGQTPNRLPDTILSLDKENKLKIPFVQGRFNMGGTGVLRFCGRRHLQLVISRRNPAIVKAMQEDDPSAPEWGFTIVRRQDPPGKVRNTVYTYLAPVGARESPKRGRVLRFACPELPLMPRLNEPYVRNTAWGTAIKLYDYQSPGFRSNMMRKGGLLHKLDLWLPDPALPARLHECRTGYGGTKERSYDTPMYGLLARLEAGRGKALEPQFPDTVKFCIEGESVETRQELFSARIYALKKGREDTYRRSEGIVFTVNGQTHGFIPASFFHRNPMRLGKIARSILIAVDCSHLSNWAREDLFPNSRDRLSNGDLRVQVEAELAQIVHRHSGLKKLWNERRAEEAQEKLADSKPFEDILRSILRESPSLAALFNPGKRLSSPHKRRNVKESETPFTGKKHPTFFRFRKLDYGRVLERGCPLNRRCRLFFETDVENEYFDRNELPGDFKIRMLNGDGTERGVTHFIHLHDGIATLNIQFPDDTAVGDVLTLDTVTTDATLVEPFVNRASVRILTEEDGGGSTSPRHRRPPSDESGDDTGGPAGIEIPTPRLVREPQWHEYGFDQYSACTIEQGQSDTDPNREVYDFAINVDNTYLHNEIKYGSTDAAIQEARFIWGNVLVALALIREEAESRKREEQSEDAGILIEEKVTSTTRALGPFLLPMIHSLGGLESVNLGSFSFVGDDE